MKRFTERELKEHRRKYNRQWRKDNPEYDKQYYLNNCEKRKQYSRQWSKDNPEYMEQWLKDKRCKEIRERLRGKTNPENPKYIKQWLKDYK